MRMIEVVLYIYVDMMQRRNNSSWAEREVYARVCVCLVAYYHM